MAARTPGMPSAVVTAGARAERAHGREVGGVTPQLAADDLPRDGQRGQGRDAAEDREGDRGRRDGPLCLGHGPTEVS